MTPEELYSRARAAITAPGAITVLTVDIRERDGRIEIEPAATPMSLIRRAGSSTAVPTEKLSALTDVIVRDTLEEGGLVRTSPEPPRLERPAVCAGEPRVGEQTVARERGQPAAEDEEGSERHGDREDDDRSGA